MAILFLKCILKLSVNTNLNPYLCISTEGENHCLWWWSHQQLPTLGGWWNWGGRSESTGRGMVMKGEEGQIGMEGQGCGCALYLEWDERRHNLNGMWNQCAVCSSMKVPVRLWMRTRRATTHTVFCQTQAFILLQWAQAALLLMLTVSSSDF